MYHLKILLGIRNLSLKKWQHLRLLCQQSYILYCYWIENIFNVNTFILSGQCLPNKTFPLIWLLAGNDYDVRFPMFVTKNFKKPRCFKGVKCLPCQYRAQCKSWYLEKLFEEWLWKPNQNFGSVKSKIDLIIDNCTAHPQVENLDWIELSSISPNTMSHTQLMNKCIIRALKAKYRSLTVHKLISVSEKKEQIPTIFVLSTMIMLEKTWNWKSTTSNRLALLSEIWKEYLITKMTPWVV